MATKKKGSKKSAAAKRRAAVRAGRLIPADYRGAVMEDIDAEWNRAVRAQRRGGLRGTPDEHAENADERVFYMDAAKKKVESTIDALFGGANFAMCSGALYDARQFERDIASAEREVVHAGQYGKYAKNFGEANGVSANLAYTIRTRCFKGKA